jgi:hypothetical protein
LKTSCIFIVLFLAAGICSLAAQDLIVLKDGNMIEVKLIEISPSEIRYKRFDNLDGPTFVVPAANVYSLKYENGKTELINAVPISGEKKPPAMEPDKLYFGISADPSGFLMYGPSALIEFAKNHFNSQFYVSFPSIGLMIKADGFGIGAGASLNYLWLTRLGAFYLGALFDYSGYKVSIPGLIQMPNGKYTDGNYDYPGESLWEGSYTFALNLGYKFVLASGLYFNTGANVGATMVDDVRSRELKFNIFTRPNTSVGYNF